MNETQKQFVDLKDTRLTKERLLEDQNSLKQQSSEMNPDDWNLKMKSIEVEILKARGDIYKMEADLGLDKDDPETKKLEEEALKEIESLEAEMEMVISSDQAGLEAIEEANKIVFDTNIVCKKITDRGYTLENINKLGNSENPTELAFYHEMESAFEDLRISERIDKLEKINPNLLTDVLIPNLNEVHIKMDLLKNLAKYGGDNINHSKIVDSFIKNIPKDIHGEDFISLKESIDSRLIDEKRKTLENLPTEEVLDLIVAEPELLDTNFKAKLRARTKKLCESYMQSRDIESIKLLIDKLSIISTVERYNMLVSGLPEIAEGVYFNEADTISLFSGDMPQWIFTRYYSQIISGPFMNLVPKKLLSEKSFHENFNNIESVSLELLNETLSKFDLSFQDLSKEEKYLLLEKGGEKIISLYKAEDFDQMLDGAYINIDLIPVEYQSDLKESLLKSYIKYGNTDSYDSINNFLAKTNFKVSDFSLEKQIKILDSYDTRNISLFEPEDIKSLIYNNIKDVKVYNMKEMLERAGLAINDLPEEIQVVILNKNYYSTDFTSMLNPNDLKKIILREDSSIQNSGQFENILEYTNTKISEFSTRQKYQIYLQFNYSVEKIGKLFQVEDLREILSDRAHYINLESIPEEYMDSLSKEVVQIMISSMRPDHINNKEKRNWLFDKIREHNGAQEIENNLDVDYDKQQKLERIKRIQESFYFIDQQEKVPEKLLEKFNNFKEKYGKKGEGIMALCIISYGMEDIDKLMKNIEEIESILNLYDKENIPEGCKVTQGIEYEVGDLTGEEFDKESIIGYVHEAELIGISANIKRGGGGTGSIYEHATRPTDNPYMLMIEMKLLADAGLIDLNHKDFENGSRGYHSNMGGETGLSAVSTDMNFLYNTMTLASLAGLNLGTEIHSVKSIHEKTLEGDIFEKQQGGHRVEIKGMGCDCIEQFNKSIMTVHNSCVAIQVMEKYLNNSDKVLDKMPSDIDSFDSFINIYNLSKSDNGFLSQQEKEITFTWLKFKKDILLALRQHNDSFAQSEFAGFVENDKGEFVNTSDDIDINLNRNKLTEKGIDYLDSEKMKKLYELPEESLFGAQTSTLLRNLGHVNNTFVFKEPILSEDKLYVDKKTAKTHVKRVFMSNAYSTLTDVRAKGYIKNVPGSSFDSIVDTKGEMRDGYYHYQGASEEMISHKSQIIVNEFNKNMKDLLVNISKEKLSMEKIEQYEGAI